MLCCLSAGWIIAGQELDFCLWLLALSSSPQILHSSSLKEEYLEKKRREKGERKMAECLKQDKSQAQDSYFYGNKREGK